MSEVIPSGPEVVRFEGAIWRTIPDIHEVFKDVGAAIEYYSRGEPPLEVDRYQHVVFQHDKEEPEHYLFVCDLAQNKGYNIYNLAIDESEDFARLYVINVIDRGTLREEGQANWHREQLEMAMVIPNSKERHIMKRLIRDFYEKTMTGV